MGDVKRNVELWTLLLTCELSTFTWIAVFQSDESIARIMAGKLSVNDLLWILL